MNAIIQVTQILALVCLAALSVKQGKKIDDMVMADMRRGLVISGQQSATGNKLEEVQASIESLAKQQELNSQGLTEAKIDIQDLLEQRTYALRKVGEEQKSQLDLFFGQLSGAMAQLVDQQERLNRINAQLDKVVPSGLGALSMERDRTKFGMMEAQLRNIEIEVNLMKSQLNRIEVILGSLEIRARRN